jgi:hypothetical protein
MHEESQLTRKHEMTVSCGMLVNCYASGQKCGLDLGVVFHWRWNWIWEFIGNLPAVPKETQYKGVDGGAPSSGRHAYTFGLLNRTAQQNRGSRARIAYEITGGQRREPLQAIQHLFFERYCPEQDVQKVPADGAMLQRCLPPYRASLPFGAADDNGRSSGHTMRITNVIEICNCADALLTSFGVGLSTQPKLGSIPGTPEVEQT